MEKGKLVTINEAEVTSQLLRKRKATSECLREEQSKRQKMQKELDTVNKQVKQQAQQITALKFGNPVPRHQRKPWSESSRQLQYKRRKQLASQLSDATSFSKTIGFKACSIELENIETGQHEMVDLASGKFTAKQVNMMEDNASSILYVKDKFAISDTSYHELSMISDLPSSSKIKELKKQLNTNYDIKSAPRDIKEVQQSLKSRLLPRLTNIVNNTPTDNLPTHFRVKLTGDGTQIGIGITVVNVAFTILEEGDKACSSSGNHTLAIFKLQESEHQDLYDAMQDLVIEASNLKTVTINDKQYNIEYFLGGDMKFLAIVNGIESATATYPCIWCKCPKNLRHKMELNWSITDTKLGARTVEEISSMSKFSKSSKSDSVVIITHYFHALKLIML